MVPVASNRRDNSSVTGPRLALASGRTYDKLGPAGAQPAQGPVVELGKAPKSKGRPNSSPPREPSVERSSLSDKVRQWVERGLPIGVLVVALIGAPVMIFSPEGLPRLRGLERELAAVEAENRELAHELEERRGAAARLRDDPAALERIARDDLGLVRQTEIVFQFETPKR
jgi:cell division protein FtsB